MLNPNASAFAYACDRIDSPLLLALDRLEKCNVSAKDRKQLKILLEEWFTTSTLNSILTTWERHNQQKKKIINKFSMPMSFVLYNMQGLNLRSLEVIELVSKTDASFIVRTEVGEIWYKSNIPNYNMFYEKGTNKNGGVVIHSKKKRFFTELKKGSSRRYTGRTFFWFRRKIGFVSNLSWTVLIKVSQKWFRIKPFHQIDKKVLYQRFRTKPFLQNVKKVSRVPYITIISLKYLPPYFYFYTSPHITNSNPLHVY